MQTGKVASICGFVCLASLGVSGTVCRPLWSQIPSDESGTLVMVARTANAVIVSVDSKIMPHDSAAPPPAVPATPVSGDRKLVEVGELSACALEGFVGSNETNLDVSASMRSWIAANPKTEAREAIDALLDAAADAWDHHKFTLEQIRLQTPSRTDGSRITTITCGEVVDGQPIIITGQTYVKAEGLSVQVAAKRRLQPDGKGYLHIGGAIPSANYFVMLVASPQYSPLSNKDEINDQDKAVREDIRANSTAMSALYKWNAVLSVWTQAEVKELFVPTFASVEKHLPEVGPPNNLRILTTCGRLEKTTVEAEWPKCPPSAPSAAQEKSGSLPAK